MLRLKILASVVPVAIAALFARGESVAGPGPCIEISDTSVQIAHLSWHAQRHVSFTAEAGACENSAPPQPGAISKIPSATDPVIYLSKSGPADYRIFVSSSSFSLLDAAALIVGARSARHGVNAASL